MITHYQYIHVVSISSNPRTAPNSAPTHSSIKQIIRLVGDEVSGGVDAEVAGEGGGAEGGAALTAEAEVGVLDEEVGEAVEGAGLLVEFGEAAGGTGLGVYYAYQIIPCSLLPHRIQPLIPANNPREHHGPDLRPRPYRPHHILPHHRPTRLVQLQDQPLQVVLEAQENANGVGEAGVQGAEVNEVGGGGGEFVEVL